MLIKQAKARVDGAASLKLTEKCAAPWKPLTGSRELLKPLIGKMEVGLPGPSRTEGNQHSADSEANLSRDFEQFEANGATLGMRQVSVGQTVLPQALHQDIGKRREPQA